MFPILELDLPTIAEARLSPSDLMDTNNADPKLIGRCYAYDYERLINEAKEAKTTCHLWLLHRGIAALWEEHPRQKVFVCYQAIQSMMRLFLCSKREISQARLYKVLSASPAYIETGRDCVPISRVRPLVYWEPPSDMMALWPVGFYGETDAGRVIDSGQLVSWHSYPESDHDQSVPVDEAGPEYTRVPTDEHGSFILKDRRYRYVNRWGIVE